MNKLKMLVVTGLTAATIGTGALAAAPSASAAAATATTTAQTSASVDRPRICFQLGPWIYCI
jgi:hypothetical protein